MDFVYIHDLKLTTVIGAYTWEQTIKQTLYLDIEIGTHAKLTAVNDDLSTTPNYADIAKRVLEQFENHQCKMLETLAEKIAQLILIEFKVKWLRLKIRKLGILAGAKEVGIVIERHNDSEN